MGAAAAEQAHEQRPEMAVDLLERGQQPLPPFAVQLGDAATQLLDGLDQVTLLRFQGAELLLQFLGLLLGAQVDRAHGLAFAV